MANPIKVLIVEDHQVTRDGLAAGLCQETDISIVGAVGNSDQALQLLHELAPEVILLDLHVPGSLGPRTMVEKFSRSSPAKVIVFSVEKRLAFVKVVMNLGISAYLLKSEQVKKVAEVIRRVLNGEKNILSEEIHSDQTKITKSEQEVLHLIGRGLKYQDIADQRLTSPNTVRKQCEILLLKLGLSSREELIAWSVNNGYASLEE